jgi:hypothetical protein|tara:strand:- start:395 stop:514 length:120 start_codon:yes stop_codon:yes gene_type:complete
MHPAALTAMAMTKISHFTIYRKVDTAAFASACNYQAFPL